jgi:hypothetical protein
MGEQECAALILGETALELPAHQRVQLGILVDRAIDAGDQPLRLQGRQMLLEIERRPIGQTGAAGRGRNIEHGRSSGGEISAKLRLVAPATQWSPEAAICRVGNAPPQHRSRGTAYRRVAHASGSCGAIAWAKLRGAAQIMRALPGNFAHPTTIGFMESIH